MACKETMVVAPLVVMLYDRAFRFESFRRSVSPAWPLLRGALRNVDRARCADVVRAARRFGRFRRRIRVAVGVPPESVDDDRRYLRLAFWPRDLVLDYGEPSHVTFAEVAPYFMIVAGLVVATVSRGTRKPALGFLGAWFFLTLAPTSSIMPISTEVGAERRMYLPLMAVVVAVVAPWHELSAARVAAAGGD
jgi:hypothetical protein